MNTSARRPFADLPADQQAGILCNDPQFQSFAASRCGFENTQFSNSASAQYLRDCCQINSRRLLATDATAQFKFQALRTEFDAWAGRIARQQ